MVTAGVSGNTPDLRTPACMTRPTQVAPQRLSLAPCPARLSRNLNEPALFRTCSGNGH